MGSVVFFPAIALVAGAACGSGWDAHAPALVWGLPPGIAAALAAWWLGRARLLLVCVSLASGVAGAALGADARERALQPSLRTLLNQEYGGFLIAELGPAGTHDALPMRGVLTEDAAVREDHVSLRVAVTAVALQGEWHAVEGGVGVSVSGTPMPERAAEWRAGRHIEAPVTFRRPTRHLNHGVPDAERNLALGGTTLFGSVKSGLLVEVVARGNPIQEIAAAARAHVRHAVRQWVSGHDGVSGAIVTAILIGDRTGLPDEIRTRLQAAGTYHVIAISGGNIAILAALIVALLALVGMQGRRAAVVTIVVLLAYAQVVTTEPSVWRATLMAVLFFAARVVDHRTSPWHALTLTAAVMVVVQPLDVRNPGFILSFGATAALLEGARLGRGFVFRRRALAWVVASVTASSATEIALLPVSAYAFSRVTSAGLVLNLLAVPVMTVIQMAGMTVAILQPLPWIAGPAGWVAHAGSVVLTDSARLVDAAPWLAARVPAPHVVWMPLYYVALWTVVHGRRRAKWAAAPVLLVAVLAIVGLELPRPRFGAPSTPDLLRVTVFDVGQAEALLIEPPDGGPLLVDAAGAPFGGSFDVGGRVLVPAIWARGIRSLDALLVTHGHPDHAGGAPAVLRDLRVGAIWDGVPVPADALSGRIAEAAARHGVPIEPQIAGASFTLGGVHLRVLHPPRPDWERQQVRNDDSVVIEIVHGDVALLLTGDISAEIERQILPQLTPARIRILKVAHHGSRSSSSADLLEAWRPQLALISCGRGNTFGHPAPEVLDRLEASDATILRTDRHGQISIETDGRTFRVTTYVDGEPLTLIGGTPSTR